MKNNNLFHITFVFYIFVLEDVCKRKRIEKRRTTRTKKKKKEKAYDIKQKTFCHYNIPLKTCVLPYLSVFCAAQNYALLTR